MSGGARHTLKAHRRRTLAAKSGSWPIVPKTAMRRARVLSGVSRSVRPRKAGHGIAGMSDGRRTSLLCAYANVRLTLAHSRSKTVCAKRGERRQMRCSASIVASSSWLLVTSNARRTLCDSTGHRPSATSVQYSLRAFRIAQNVTHWWWTSARSTRMGAMAASALLPKAMGLDEKNTTLSMAAESRRVIAARRTGA